MVWSEEIKMGEEDGLDEFSGYRVTRSNGRIQKIEEKMREKKKKMIDRLECKITNSFTFGHQQPKFQVQLRT